MKNTIKIITLCLFTLSYSCQNWIDISPKTDVDSEKLFKDEAGFKSALIGIYGRMTNDETYGNQLSFNFIEQLAQRYDNQMYAITDEERARIYDYKNTSSSKNIITSIWNNMYRNISNINNLLEKLETNGNVIKTAGYFNMIKGEALALRAYHYFDLMRLWGPIYSEAPQAKAVPYRDEFNIDTKKLMPANELADTIISTLKRAEQLLEEDGMDYLYNADNVFIGERKHRLNKYAVKALLARVYIYIGDKTNAALCADDVIKHSGLSLVRDNHEDVSLYGETLFCLGMFDMEDRVSSYWKNTQKFNTEYWISKNNADQLFEGLSVGINDMRYKNNYGFMHVSSQFMCRKYFTTTTTYSGKLPLIRLAEMYLIKAEAAPLSEYAQYINTLRNARGISRSNNIVVSAGYTEENRTKDLLKEYQKEFFAEGQVFYFMKRHNLKTFYRCPVSEMAYYTFPIPDDEVEYGNTTD